MISLSSLVISNMLSCIFLKYLLLNVLAVLQPAARKPSGGLSGLLFNPLVYTCYQIVA
jgi:hypothetical protein